MFLTRTGLRRRSGELVRGYDVCEDGEEADYDGWDDGVGWLGAFAPLRSDLLSGDWRLLYLLWLAAVDGGGLRDDALEPIAGIGPLTGGLEVFARFFRMDLDLVRAAAERTEHAELDELSSEVTVAALVSIPVDERTMKSFRPKEGGDDDAQASGGRNAERDFRGERRSNATHASSTDADARLYRKGQGQSSRLCFVGCPISPM